MMSMLDKAIEIAKKAHEGQVDKIGESYINHVMRIVEQVEGKEKIVAALHDVVEDTDVTLKDLEEFGKEIVIAVDCISHRDKEPYTEYIALIDQNDLAREVKIADLLDHLDPIRKRGLTDKMKNKYWGALDILKGGADSNGNRVQKMWRYLYD